MHDDPPSPAGTPPVPPQPPGWPQPTAAAHPFGAPAGAQYPPPPYAPYPPPRPLPRKTNTTKVTLITVGAVIGGILFVCGGVMTVGLVSEQNTRSRMSVTPTRCHADSLGIAHVEFEVTNRNSTPERATVEIEYRDATGALLDRDTHYTQRIGPGDTARAQESTVLDGKPQGTITCRVRIG